MLGMASLQKAQRSLEINAVDEASSSQAAHSPT